MPLTIKIFTKQSGRPTLFQTREFDTLPVTLGRDATCTVALDDPMKHISRVHVELEEESGTYYLSVVSKVNPVMVKGKRHGPGSRVALQNGDSFEMGEFEVQVLVTEKKKAPGQPSIPPQKKSMIESFAAEDDAPPPKPAPPVDPGIFDEPTLLGEEEPTFIGKAKKPAAPPAPAPKGSGPSMKDAVRAFLDGASMPQKDLPPAQAEQLLRECGAMLRACVEGMMMLLIARSEMRKEFEAEQRTMVASRDNNPLKLMGDPQEAMDYLFDPAHRDEGFLGPVQAITDAAEDLRAHELALMAGMRAAIMGAVRRFDPQALEKAFAKSAGGFSIGGRKAKMWELFVEHQQNLAQEAQEDFNKAFGRDFMAAYQSQLQRLKPRT